AVPIEKSEIQRCADHMRVELLFDLIREQPSRPAVNGAMHDVHRTSVKDGQLQEVGVWYDAGQSEASRHRHLDLSLQERLADLKVRKQLSALVELRLDPSPRGCLDLSEIVPDSNIARMRGHGFKRATQDQRLLGGCARAKRRRGDDCRCGTHEGAAG